MKTKEDYYDHIREEMVQFLPNTINKSLEVGCSRGNFSKFLKSKYKNYTVGIEIDLNSAEIASSILDDVFVGDAIQNLKKISDESFDLIICNDILEHIIDEKVFLQNLVRILERNGTLIFSIPNVRYWHNVLNFLIKKDWHYVSHGILDSTHVRFYTKKSIIRLFESIGLNVVKITGLNPTPSKAFYIFNLLTFGFINDMQYLQYGIRLSK
jgi:2-polyprenyl-3-methyl-5-hydroxy-6-metoxy-1,4-benzoquinol methylase